MTWTVVWVVLEDGVLGQGVGDAVDEAVGTVGIGERARVGAAALADGGRAAARVVGVAGGFFHTYYGRIQSRGATSVGAARVAVGKVSQL